MRVLILSSQAENVRNAYRYRIDSLAAMLGEEGVGVDMMHLGRPGRILRGSAAVQLRAATRKLPWNRYDYFHAAGSMLTAVLSLRRRPAAKLVLDSHGLRYAELELRRPGLAGRLRVGLTRYMHRVAARRADLCITVSRPLVEILSRWRGRPEGVALIRNGVDLEDLPPLPADAPPRGGDSFVVGYAGGFQPWQAVDLLVETAAVLRDRPKIRWRIIGFSDADREVKRQMAAAMPPGTELIDRCDQPAVRKLLRECDLLAIPRRPYLACRVAFPTKFAEYLLVGRPVLVNTVDETHEITREIGCGFVASPQPQDMARAVLAAAATPKHQRRAMGRAGRRFVQRELSWKTIGRRYKEFLEANLSRPGAAAEGPKD